MQQIWQSEYAHITNHTLSTAQDAAEASSQMIMTAQAFPAG